MSYFILKCIAIVCMLIDHIGYVGGFFAFRLIGRISFPIFAFLVSNGLKYTHNKRKYALRMFLFALVSEIPFDLLQRNRVTLRTFDNVFFTLLLGLLFLILLNELKSRFEKKKWLIALIGLFALAVVCLTAALISCDYGWPGVLTVVLFGVFDFDNKKHRVWILLGIILLSGWSLWSYIIYSFVAHVGFDLYSIKGTGLIFSAAPPNIWIYIGFIQVISLIPIFAYNGESGQPENKLVRKTFQYGFYAFYPVHMIILYFIRLIMM